VTLLLDHNVVAYFFNAGCENALAACSHNLSMAVAEAVRDEGQRGYPKRYDAWLAQSAIEVRAIAVGSAEDALLEAIHPSPQGSEAIRSTRDFGEHASIALAACDPTLTFVANDKGALWLALQELHQPGERVLGLRVFLRRAHAMAGLPLAAIDKVVAKAQGKAPTWWAGWRAQASPGAL
jgi:hypothetical protein